MTLITRLGRLFRADLNAVLDGLEEPAMLLKQSVRDMEEVLAGEDAEQARLGDEAQRLGQASDEASARLAALDEELTLCLAADKDELARNLVRRKLEASRHLTLLTERRQALAEAHRRLAARIVEHRQRLAALRAQAALADSVSAVTRDEAVSPWQPASVVSEAEIEVALLREKQRRAQS
jgi:phage shock protein A